MPQGFRARTIDVIEGRTIKATELERLADEVQRATTLSGSQVVDRGFGKALLENQPESFWAKVTAKDGSTPAKYSWTQVFPDGAGGWVTPGDGISGTATNLPAFEYNSAVITTFPFYVRMFYGTANWMVFSFSSSPAGALTVEYDDTSLVVNNVSTVQVDHTSMTLTNPSAGTVKIGSLGGSSGVEIKEADGSPDYTGVGVIIVDQATGLAIESGSTGNPVTIEILAASTTQQGAVTTGTQTFGGNKTFHDNLTVASTGLFTANGGAAINYSPTAPGGCNFVGPFAIVYPPDADAFFGLDLNGITKGDAAGTGTRLAFSAVGTAGVMLLTSVTGGGTPGAGFYAVADSGGTTQVGTTVSIPYAKPGGGSGTITVIGGIITAAT